MVEPPLLRSSKMTKSMMWFLDQPSDKKVGYRAKVRCMFHSKKFDLTMGLVVAFNIVLVIMEVDSASLGEDIPWYVTVFNRALVFVYLAELGLRFFVWRLQMFRDPYTIVDCLVVLIDLFSSLVLDSFSNSSILRVIRLAKLSRTVHLVQLAPELHTMLKGLVAACKSIMWGSLLAIMFVTFWSILAVELVQPTNDKVTDSGYYTQNMCERCPRAYDTVWQSAITFTQTIIFGDSWGMYAVPIMEEEPILLGFFVLVYVSLNLAVLNLILAVIVDAAQQAREKSVHDIALEKEEAYSKCREQLIELCHQLDVDSDGQLSLPEVQNGYLTNPDFSDILKRLEVRVTDLPIVFGVMDSDGSGMVSVEEFIAEVYKMQRNDVQGMVIHIKYYVTQIQRQLVDHIDTMSSLLAKQNKEEEALLNDLNRTVVEQSQQISRISKISNLFSTTSSLTSLAAEEKLLSL